MKRADVIHTILSAIITLVSEANQERDNNPREYKLRNHYISQALGMYGTLQIMQAFDDDVMQSLRKAIEDYNTLVIYFISENKIKPFKRGVSSDE